MKILYDEDGNEYLAEIAKLKSKEDDKAKYQRLFLEKIDLYKTYFVELLGDEFKSYIEYEVEKVTGENVYINKKYYSEGWEKLGTIKFKKYELRFSDEKYISILKNRARKVLLKHREKTLESKYKSMKRYDKEIKEIDKLIDSIKN